MKEPKIQFLCKPYTAISLNFLSITLLMLDESRVIPRSVHFKHYAFPFIT